MIKIANKENIIMSNLNIASSGIIENDVTLEAKFIICDFEPNGNNVMLNRQTIGMWLDSLVSNPVVGKIGVNDDGKCDFEGHNVSIVQRVAEDGTVYQDAKFDTSAMGVFTDVAIEKIDDKEFIIATARIWKRFPEFCAVIKRRIEEGKLYTSWEIAVKKSHIELVGGKKIKVIDEGVFIGHTLLNSHFPPAYKDSQLLEVASQNTDDTDLIDAIEKDIANIIPEQKEVTTLNENENNQVAELENDATNTQTVEPEKAALTEYDLRKSVRQAVADKLNKDKWEFYIIHLFPTAGEVWVQMWDAESELDVITFTFTVDSDAVTVSEPINAKLSVSISQINTTFAEMQSKIDVQTSSLVTASETISGLEKSISELTPFKEAFEKSEQEKIEKEISEKKETLKAYALKSGYISKDEIEKSEDIKALIESVNESGIKAIIAERFMAGLEKSTQEESVVETSAKDETPKANILDGETPIDHKTFIGKYIGK